MTFIRILVAYIAAILLTGCLTTTATFGFVDKRGNIFGIQTNGKTAGAFVETKRGTRVGVNVQIPKAKPVPKPKRTKTTRLPAEKGLRK